MHTPKFAPPTHCPSETGNFCRTMVQGGSRLLPALVVVACGIAGMMAAENQPETTTPIILSAGNDWIPLAAQLEIAPGSALDFSQLGFVDPPAGKYGRVIARPDGQFAFTDSPATARRFYGVNLCFSAQYLAHEEADQLAARLVRLGYNAVRIHHYEGELTRGQTNSTTLNPAQLEKLDYLTAALIQRGIYLTTDLFVSRSISYREIGMEKNGPIAMDTFKILVPVHQGAFENWERFVRALLTHTNPYTHRRYADEPALAWLSLINEGNFGNFYKDLHVMPDWISAWNHWLVRHYSDRAGLAQAWGNDLKDDEDAAAGSVALPENLRGPTLRARDCIAFLSDTERNMVQRMKQFLRSDLGCRSLVSNANSWTYFVTDQATRTEYDYVDDHFYVDHPQFVEQPWRLPSKCPNTSPIAEGASGGRSKAFTRVFGKPFTITEYNYSAPGRFRGVGGILTGAMAALQGWGGIWRFAYSHSRDAMFTPSRMGYFDLASDPLSQDAERASLCLFVRGDLAVAPHRAGIAMTPDDLANPPSRIPNLHLKWNWAAWNTRVGTAVLPTPEEGSALDLLLPLGWKTPVAAYPARQTVPLNPYSTNDGEVLAALRSHAILGSANPTSPTERIFQSETGEITINGLADTLALDTARTAGGYAPAGHTIDAPSGGVHISVQDADATVWVSSLDSEPIAKSRRLLITHLTDLQNTGIRYAEVERKTLLDWGRLPYLVRAGKATVTLHLDQPSLYQVWALDSSGRRLAQVPAQAKEGQITFSLDVAAEPAQGARMLYEVATE